MKRKTMIKKSIAVLALIAAIGVMIYSGGQLKADAQTLRECNSVYDGLRNTVRGSAANGHGAAAANGHGAAAANGHGAAVESGAAVANGAGSGLGLHDALASGHGEAASGLSGDAINVSIPGLWIDFDALRAINDDAVAWLYCPDTVIDYPVMRAGDYDYYLHHLADGTPNPNGSLFIDYNNASDFSDELTVIYGHHMKSGSMFGGLKGYKDQVYYNEHPYMYLYTQHGNFRIDIMYGFVIDAALWIDRAFMHGENIDSLLAYAAHNTTFLSEAGYVPGDRIAAMSTCSYEFEGARYVVLGILRGEFIESEGR